MQIRCLVSVSYVMALGSGQEVYATSGQAADDALGASNQISGSTLVVGAPDYAGTRWQVFTFTLTVQLDTKLKTSKLRTQ